MRRIIERLAAGLAGAARGAASGVAWLVRVLRLDHVLRWYGEHRVARQWTVNLAGAAFLVWFAGIAKDWIQPTLTPDMLFPSVTIGPQGVRVAEAEYGSVAQTATYTGQVQPWEENVVYARVDGYVSRLHVYPGDYVRRGQQLVTLETSNLEPRLAEAVVDSTFFAAEFRRDSVLYAEKAISASELDRSRNRFEAASAKVELLRTQIGYASIRALTDGWVADRKVYEGQYVRAGEPVVKVDDLARVRIQFEVAEEHLSTIRPGTVVYVRFPQLDPEVVRRMWPGRLLRPREELAASGSRGSDASAAAAVNSATHQGSAAAPATPAGLSNARADALPQSGNWVASYAHALEAEVAVVFPAEDPATRTGLVEVRLENPGPLLRTNTYVVGDFVVREGDRGVRVPVSALTPMPGGKTVVFVLPPIVEQGAVEEREVVVGVRNSEWVELLSGVEPGERVVYRGNRGLVDGQPVMVINPGRGL